MQLPHPHCLLTHHQVAAGGAPGAQHAALLTRGGEVYTWGSGAGGKLGHGTNSGVLAPQQVRAGAMRRSTTAASSCACGTTASRLACAVVLVAAGTAQEQVNSTR